jgi:UDP-N-acetyl-D-mannosaminuronate dehydrogenase
MYPISLDMSTNSQVQELLDRIIEIQRRVEDLGPSVHNDRVQSQYEHVRTKIADAKTAIMGLVYVFDRYSASQV